MSGKTSKIVHKMFQDIMLGTLDKNRTAEYQEKVNLKVADKGKRGKLLLIGEFLKARFTETQNYKIDQVDHEDKLKRNPYKYNIYEEQDIINVIEMQSTAWKPMFVMITAALETDGLELVKEVDKQSPVVSESNCNAYDPPDKASSTAKIFGFHTKK